MAKIWWNVSDKYDLWQGIWWKGLDWWKQRKTLNTDIEVLKLRKLSSQKNIDDLEKESDERYQMDMIDDKEYDERYQTNNNDEETVTENIEVLKLVKLSSQKNIDNIEK